MNFPLLINSVYKNLLGEKSESMGIIIIVNISTKKKENKNNLILINKITNDKIVIENDDTTLKYRNITIKLSCVAKYYFP